MFAAACYSYIPFVVRCAPLFRRSFAFSFVSATLSLCMYIFFPLLLLLVGFFCYRVDVLCDGGGDGGGNGGPVKRWLPIVRAKRALLCLFVVHCTKCYCTHAYI